MSHYRVFPIVVAIFLNWALPQNCSGQGLAYIKANYTKYEYKIPMRDGTRLFTAVYVPKDDSKTYPILLKRTPYSVRPYGVDQYPSNLGPSELFGKAGYIFAYQDVRGRWMSEGKFVQMRPHRPTKNGPREFDESTDTWDTVEWLVKNIRGNNRRVGIAGISYPGFYTAAGIIDSHPALKAASPQAPVNDWFAGDDWHHNGAFFMAHMFNWMSRNGRVRPKPTKKYSVTFDYGTPDGFLFFQRIKTLSEIDARYLKGQVPFWKETLRHGNYDEFWKSRNIRPHLKNIKPAVMTVGGWFDAENLFGALETYKSIEANNPKTSNTLVMGPWRHGGWSRGDGASFGDIPFNSKTSEFYREKIEFPFFQKHLKGKLTPKRPEAWVFETGTNRWKQYDKWPPKSARPRSLYFRSGRPGRLDERDRHAMNDSNLTQTPAPLKIAAVAAQLGLAAGDAEPYGWYKAKLALGLEQTMPLRPETKYVDVTAVNPTPLGEGKTVVSIGLAMALSRRGRRAITTLREPSLAPVFGIKGGGAGGGHCRLFPSEEINLHFTGDLHAVTSATNLLAAMVDNHAQRGLSPKLDVESITWRRALDISDKGLAHIATGLDEPPQAPRRETGFDLTAASEVMAILALATGLQDLRRRLDRIIVGRDLDGNLIRVQQIGCGGSMAALLRDALRPNLVQTCEQSPAIVHTGPFGNIAHGNCSILADMAAFRLADYVVTESGFGSDCGAEKFFNIKCRTSGLRPSASVVVCTVRALKYQSGRFQVRPGRPLPAGMMTENLEAVETGACNLQAHIDIVRRFGVPAVVAINRFPEDSNREIDRIRQIALDSGAVAAVSTNCFAEGSGGALELADAVTAACSEPNAFQFLYPLEMSPAEKFETVATQIYGAEGVDFSETGKTRLEELQRDEFARLPVCIAKTQYSLSHDSKLLGRPRGFRLPIRDIHVAAGAGFVYALAGNISTMPGLPKEPAALHIDVDEQGRISGIR
eukprot:g10217.t1